MYNLFKEEIVGFCSCLDIIGEELMIRIFDMDSEKFYLKEQ
jgi:hypothetical protein